MELCIDNQIWNLETLYFEKKKKKKEHLPNSDLKAGRKSECLKLQVMGELLKHNWSKKKKRNKGSASLQNN